MAEAALQRPDDAKRGRFFAPPLPGRNVEPIPKRRILPSIPQPPKAPKIVRAERIERLKGGHVRGMLARAGLQQLVPEKSGRWSHHKGLFTEIVQASQGSSISDLLVILTRAKELNVEHWPECIKAAEKLKQLQSMHKDLESALSSCSIEVIAELLQQVAAEDLQGQDFRLLVSAVEQRLQRLSSLRRELRRAARSSDVMLLSGTLQMAGELGVTGQEVTPRWKEVEVAEVRLKVLHALLAKMIGLLGMVGEVEEAAFLEVLRHAARVLEEDPLPPVGWVVKAVREQFQQRYGYDYTAAGGKAEEAAQEPTKPDPDDLGPTELGFATPAAVSAYAVQGTSDAGSLVEEALAGTSEHIVKEILHSGLLASASTTQQVPLLPPRSEAGSQVFEDSDAISGERIIQHLMQSELPLFAQPPTGEDDSRPAEPVVHREPVGNEDACSHLCRQLVDDLMSRELEEVEALNQPRQMQAPAPRPFADTPSAETVQQSIGRTASPQDSAASQWPQRGAAGGLASPARPQKDDRDDDVPEDEMGRSSRAIAEGIVQGGLRPLAETPSAETVQTSGRQSRHEDSQASDPKTVEPSTKGLRVHPGSCLPSTTSVEAQSSIMTLQAEDAVTSGQSLVEAIVHTELQHVEDKNVDVGTSGQFHKLLQDQLAELHAPDEEDAADAEVAEVLSKACSVAWMEERCCSSALNGRQSGLSPVAEMGCPPSSPMSAMEDSLADATVQNVLRATGVDNDLGASAISDAGSSQGSDVLAGLVAEHLAARVLP